MMSLFTWQYGVYSFRTAKHPMTRCVCWGWGWGPFSWWWNFVLGFHHPPIYSMCSVAFSYNTHHKMTASQKTVLITQLFLSPSSVWSRWCTVHRNAPVSCWTSCYARWCSSHPLPHQSVFSCCTSPASQSWRQWLHVLVIMNNENKNNKEIFKSANL